jgi:hypothetical protein
VMTINLLALRFAIWQAVWQKRGNRFAMLNENATRRLYSLPSVARLFPPFAACSMLTRLTLGLQQLLGNDGRKQQDVVSRGASSACSVVPWCCLLLFYAHGHHLRSSCRAWDPRAPTDGAPRQSLWRIGCELAWLPPSRYCGHYAAQRAKLTSSRPTAEASGSESRGLSAQDLRSRGSPHQTP